MSRSLDIDIGHGRTDVTCTHGSRWIWWYEQGSHRVGEGKWVNILMAPFCDHDEPPSPFKDEDEERKFIDNIGAKFFLANRKQGAKAA